LAGNEPDGTVAPVDVGANDAATSPANELPEPTDAQKDAGNYKVGRAKVGGLDISIENPQGSVRRSKADDPNPWETQMNDHYGYIKGVPARAPDKEHVDVYVKPGTADEFAGSVFVVDQVNPETGEFDEPKVMIGYGSQEEAEAAYRSNYSEDWQGFGGITEVPMPRFKVMLQGKSSFLKPLAGKKQGAKPVDTQKPVDLSDKEVYDDKGYRPWNMNFDDFKTRQQSRIAGRDYGNNPEEEADLRRQHIDFVEDALEAGTKINPAVFEGYAEIDANEHPLAASLFSEIRERQNKALSTRQEKDVDDDLNDDSAADDAEDTETPTDAKQKEAKRKQLNAGMAAYAKKAGYKDGSAKNTWANLEEYDIDGEELPAVMVQPDNKRKEPYSIDSIYVGQVPNGKWIASSHKLMSALSNDSFGEYYPEFFDSRAEAINYAVDRRIDELNKLAKEQGSEPNSEWISKLDKLRIPATPNNPSSRQEKEDLKESAPDKASAGGPDAENEVRELVASLTKRRAAARQINREKMFDAALAAAKELMNGKAVSAGKFKTWKNLLKADTELANILGQLEQMAGQSPEALAAKERKSRVAAERAKLSKQIDTTKDDILAAMAKLGGLKKDAAKSEFGFDPADMDKQGSGIYRTFNNSDRAKDLDSMREALAELGYPVGETVADFGDALDEAMAGGTVMTSEGIDARMQAEMAERYMQEYNELSDEEQAVLDAYVLEATRIFGADRVAQIDAAVAEYMADQPVAAIERELTRVLREEIDIAGQSQGTGADRREQEAASTAEGTTRQADPDGGDQDSAERQGEVDLLGDDTQAAQAVADAAAAKDQRRNSGEDNPEEFTLTGSNRPADVAAARGAQDLFGQQDQPTDSNAVPFQDTSDVGIEMIGNRRNRGLTLADVQNANNDTERVAMAVKTKLWERPNYQELVDSGVEPVFAHIIKQIYDSLSNKPAYKGDAMLYNYVETVEAAKKAIDEFLTDKDAMAEMLVAVAVAARQQSWMHQVHGMKSLGQMSSELKANAKALTYLADRIFPENEEGARWGRNNKVGNAKANSTGNRFYQKTIVDLSMFIDAIKAVEQGFPAKQELWERSYRIQEKDGKFELIKKGRYSALSAHDTREEAVEAARDRVKRQREEAFKEPDTPVEKSVRKGREIRTNGNVSSQELKDAIGLKAVNFGNWMKENSNAKERQQHVNSAFDAFHDLAEVLGLPVKAMSLDGMLGLAIGAQGKGRAAAHFIPGFNEINLTRGSGAGSLAHEWAHGLDHYFGVQAGLATTDKPFASWVSGKFNYENATIRPEIVTAFKTIVETMKRTTESVEDAKARLQFSAKAAQERIDKFITDNGLEEKVKGDANAEAALEAIRNGDDGEYVDWPPLKGRRKPQGFTANHVKVIADKLGWDFSQAGDLNSAYISHKYAKESLADEPRLREIHTNYYQEAAKLDSGKKDPYWTTPHELFARAFEMYVADKLAGADQRNDYLVAAWKLAEEANTGDEILDSILNEAKKRYPQGDERKKINDSFDVLFKEIQTKETEQGTALFSRTGPQTDSEAFKRWFGDSKVVDNDGKPLVMYHGTTNRDAILENGFRKEWVHLTDSKEVADSYQQWERGNSPDTLAVYVKAENPAYYDAQGQKYTDIGNKIFRATAEAERAGHDAIIIQNIRDNYDSSVPTEPHTTVVAFRPEQIKIATGNNGDFDPENPNILFSRGGAQPVFYSALSRAIEGIQTNKAQASIWKGMIKNLTQKGVKPDEIEWTGINEWLDMQEGSITKEQVLEYLNANGVQVTETIQGNAESDLRDKAAAAGLRLDIQRGRDSQLGEFKFTHLYDKDDKFVQDKDLPADVAKALEKFNEGNDTPKFGDYTVPGGENYKVLLLTLPEREPGEDLAWMREQENKYGRALAGWPKEVREQMKTRKDSALVQKREQGTYKSSHFDQPNILAHVRFDERTDADGSRVLFINEIQSDWGQQGKKNGFRSRLTDSEQKEMQDIESLGPNLGDKYDRYQELSAKLAGDIPSAPFVTKTDAWVALAIKRMMRYASENGFDKVAFINGQQAADLYDLSKSISRVVFEDNSTGGIGRPKMEGPPSEGVLTAYDKSGKQVIREYVAPEKVEDYIGKDAAAKLFESQPVAASSAGIGIRRYQISGQELKVGGEGMRTFYDQIVPKVAKDVLKKLGGTIDQVSISSEESDEANARYMLDADDIEAAGDKKQDVRVISESSNEVVAEFKSINEAEAWIEKREAEGAAGQQLGFAITPEMRAKIMEGLPLFSKAGASTGMPLADAQAIVDEIAKKYPAVPKVVVVNSSDELPLPAATKREIAEQRQAINEAYRRYLEDPSERNLNAVLSISDVNDVEGLFRDGKIYLNAGAINSEKRLREVFAHEAIGHLSVENMLNEANPKLFNQLVKQVNLLDKSGNKYIRRLASAVDSSQPGLDAAQRAREIIAQIAERGDQDKDMTPVVRGLWEKIRDAIKAFTKLVFNVDMTDQDVRDIVSMANRYAQGEDVMSVFRTGDTVFSRANRTPSRAAGDSVVTAAMEYLARDPEFFQTPSSDSRDVYAITKDIDPGFRVEKLGPSMTKEKKADRAWEVYVPESKVRAGVIMTNEKDVWVDLQYLREGQDRGNRIYAIAMAYAHNNGKKFIGDPLGLTKSAFYRRTENMLSSALKYGTTRHLTPHVAQEIPDEYYTGADNAWGKKQAKLDWKEGDDVHNIKQLIYTSYSNAVQNVPELKDVIYDPTTEQFKYADGRPFTDEDSQRIAAELSRAMGPYRAGSATLKRAALFNTFLRQSGQEGRRQLLDSLVNQLQGRGLAPALRGVMYSRTGPGQPNTPRQQRLMPSWNAPEASKMDDVIYALQDKHIDLKRVTQDIKKSGNEIDDRWNAYLQEELFHGRTAKRTKDFIKTEIEPLIEDMRMRGVAMADFEEFLWMRHAQERNEQIAKVNPDMPDGGSGVSTKEAKAYLAQLPADKKRAYEALAKRVDKITAGTRQQLIKYGLESTDTIEAWGAAYEHYVPLMREDMDTGFGNGTGQGYSIKGNSSKRATGSKRAVVDILANLAQQREKAIIRGEKNRVSTALIGLAKLNPQPDFWKTDSVPMIKQIGRDGLVEEVPDANYKNRDNVIVARIVNKQGKVVEHSVIFNQFDERAMRMAASLKNLDQDQIGELLGTASVITRYFASINTQYNPIFGIINILRDVQGAVLNLTSTPLAGKQKQVLRDTVFAMRGIYSETRKERKGEKADSEWAQLWEEFRNEGGQTGYRDMFKNARERGDNMEHALDPAWWQKKGWGKVISANGVLAPAEQWLVSKPGKAIFDWLSDYNETLENSVRLAAYKAAKDMGMSKQQAASIAKNLTVNFNRKGEMGRQIGALYAFFNASVQGTARLAETLFINADGKIGLSKAGKSIVYGGLLLGAMQALLLAWAGFDDDEPPEFVRDRNIVIPIGDGKYLTFPMPLGFNVIPALGRIFTEWALDDGRDPQRRALHGIEVFLDMFNPIGNAGLSMQTLAPTALDPVAALAENKDWTGRPIAREDFNSLNPTPGFTRAKDTATAFSKALSHGINELTGGTDYRPGALSPTPDQIDYLFGQIAGGVGREYQKLEQTASSAVTGENLPTFKVPLLGRFYGDATGQSSQGNQFYKNVRLLNEHQNQLKGMRKEGLDLTEYRAKHPESSLIAQGNYAERAVQGLRKRRRELLKREAHPAEIERIDYRITEVMRKLNDNVRIKRESTEKPLPARERGL
jgi:hypothetical protein